MAHLSYQRPAGRPFLHQDSDTRRPYNDREPRHPYNDQEPRRPYNDISGRPHGELLERHYNTHGSSEPRVYEVVLTGGSPWGFSLKGGSEMRSALIVSKLETGGKADREGSLRTNDVVVSVNGVLTDSRTRAIQLVQTSASTLSIVIQRSSSSQTERPTTRQSVAEHQEESRQTAYDGTEPTGHVTEPTGHVTEPTGHVTRPEHLDFNRKPVESSGKDDLSPSYGGGGRLKYGILNDMLSMPYTPVTSEEARSSFTPVKRNASPSHPRSQQYYDNIITSPERGLRPRETRSSPNLTTATSQDGKASPSPPPIPPRPRFLGTQEPAFRSLQYIPPKPDKQNRPLYLDSRNKADKPVRDDVTDHRRMSPLLVQTSRQLEPSYDPLSSESLRQQTRNYQSLQYSPRSPNPMPDVLVHTRHVSTAHVNVGPSGVNASNYNSVNAYTSGSAGSYTNSGGTSVNSGAYTSVNPGLNTNAVNTGSYNSVNSGSYTGVNPGLNTNAVSTGSYNNVNAGPYTSVNTGSYTSVNSGSYTSVKSGSYTSVNSGSYTGVNPGLNTGVTTGSYTSLNVGPYTGVNVSVNTSVNTTFSSASTSYSSSAYTNNNTTSAIQNNRYSDYTVATSTTTATSVGKMESTSPYTDSAPVTSRMPASYSVDPVKKYENIPSREPSQDEPSRPDSIAGRSTPSRDNKALLDIIHESPNSSSGSPQQRASLSVNQNNAPMLRRLSDEFGIQYQVRQVQETDFPVEETTFPVYDETPVRETPVKATPVKETFVKETPVKVTPVKETPVKVTRAKATPADEPADFNYQDEDFDDDDDDGRADAFSENRFKASRASMRKAFGIFEELNPRRKSLEKKRKQQAKRGKSKEDVSESSEKNGDGSLRRVASETFTPMKEKLRRSRTESNADDDFGFGTSHNREQNLSDPSSSKQSASKKNKKDEKRSTSDPMRKSFKDKIVRRKESVEEVSKENQSKRLSMDKKGRITPTNERPDSGGPSPESKHIRSVSLDFIPKKNELKRRSIGEVPYKYKLGMEKLPSPVESHMSLLGSDQDSTREYYRRPLQDPQRISQDPNRSSQNRDPNRSSQDRDLNRTSQDRDLTRTSQDRDLNRTSHERDLNRSSQDRDLNRSSQERDLNRTSHERDLNRSSQDRDLNRTSQERDLNKTSQNPDALPLTSNSPWHRYADVSRLSISREPDGLKSLDPIGSQPSRKRLSSGPTPSQDLPPTLPPRLVRSTDQNHVKTTTDPSSSVTMADTTTERKGLPSLDKEPKQQQQQQQQNDDVDYANQLRLQAKRLGKQQGVTSLRLNSTVSSKTVAAKPVKPVEVHRSREEAGILEYVLEYVRSPSSSAEGRTSRSSENLHDGQTEPSRMSLVELRRNSQPNNGRGSSVRRSLVIDQSSHALDDLRRPASTQPTSFSVGYGETTSSQTDQRPPLKERMNALISRKKSEEELTRRPSQDEAEERDSFLPYRRHSRSNDNHKTDVRLNRVSSFENESKFERNDVTSQHVSPATANGNEFRSMPSGPSMTNDEHFSPPTFQQNRREEVWNNLRNEVENRRSRGYQSQFINNDDSSTSANNNDVIDSAGVDVIDGYVRHRSSTFGQRNSTNVSDPKTRSSDENLSAGSSSSEVFEEYKMPKCFDSKISEGQGQDALSQSEKPLRQVPATVLQISHRRQKSDDEIECDRAIASLSKDLAPVVSLPVRVDFRETESPPSGQIESGVEPQPVSSQYNSSPRTSVSDVASRTDEEGRASPETLAQKKSELVSRIQTKVDIMKSARACLKDNITENEKLGTQITSSIEAKPLTSREFDKYKSYISDLDKIMNLLLKLAGRLARAENALLSVSEEATEAERNLLTTKRDRLKEQHEDAKRLREGIERRSTQVSAVLQIHLTEREFNEYVFFVRRKTELIKEEQEIIENLDLGEEQLNALKLTMSHSQEYELSDY